MAVAQWYSQKEFYNFETGKAVEGKETEAFEFAQVVYKDTTDVGFGIAEPYVIGWYCPKVDMATANLMEMINTATEDITQEDLTALKEGSKSISTVLTQKANDDAAKAASLDQAADASSAAAT